MALIATPSVFEPYSLQDIVGVQSCVMWVQVKTDSTLCLNRCLNPVQNHVIRLSLNIELHQTGSVCSRHPREPHSCLPALCAQDL